MKVLLRYISVVIFSVFFSLPPTAWAQSSGSAGIPDDEAGRCKYGAVHMIEFAKQSLSEPTSRPERIEKRRKLVEGWSSRMEKGEDPCLVYMDIQKAAATF